MALTDEQHIEFEQWLSGAICTCDRLVDDLNASEAGSNLAEHYDGMALGYLNALRKLKELT